jgi:hypothetical protein
MVNILVKVKNNTANTMFKNVLNISNLQRIYRHINT